MDRIRPGYQKEGMQNGNGMWSFFRSTQRGTEGNRERGGQGPRSQSEMVKANLRLVISIAQKTSIEGFHFLDLIQEGNIGLMKAVDKFEYERGYKFGTYATGGSDRPLHEPLTIKPGPFASLFI